MTARMRWGALTGSPVPWLAALAGVVLVTSLAWLSTDDPLAASSLPVDQPTSTTEAARVFSGADALGQLLIRPVPPFELLPDGEEGTGVRTEESLVAEAAARGNAPDEMRAGLRDAHFLGGLKRAWRNRDDGSVFLVIVDEFGSVAHAQAWTDGVLDGLRDVPGAVEAPVNVTGATAFRFDANTARGAQHQITYVVRRGVRVATLKVATFATIDVAAAEQQTALQADLISVGAP